MVTSNSIWHYHHRTCSATRQMVTHFCDEIWWVTRHGAATFNPQEKLLECNVNTCNLLTLRNTSLTICQEDHPVSFDINRLLMLAIKDRNIKTNIQHYCRILWHLCTTIKRMHHGMLTKITMCCMTTPTPRWPTTSRMCCHTIHRKSNKPAPTKTGPMTTWLARQH